MSTKVTFNVCEEDMDYARSAWDAAEYVLSHVNTILEKRGIAIEFDVENHGCSGDMPEKYWDEEHEDYKPDGIEIVETPDSTEDIEDFGAK